ncbi:Zn-ribbon domain-containing OB-fold protein [Pseudonocardia sp. GCM10023141]|uniref:Zn-ribbon domain-containing OB-fold protein n=1 Tax=Pseudonocardia sp. GCM10023141 TaxID=3252653 RepID=UPI0036232634
MTPADVARPVPHPTKLTEPFWAACREGRLLVQRCTSCGAHLFLPRPFCSTCLGTDLQWVESSGRGVVVTHTVVWRAQTPAFETPYVVGIVRLGEGHEMFTNLVEVDVAAVTPGMPVEVRFVPVTPTVTLPCFAPVS